MRQVVNHQQTIRFFIFIFFIVASAFNVLAQNTTETKNHLVTPTGHGFRYEQFCINEWRVTFENKTKETITSITFKLIIKNRESEDIVYQDTHTVHYTLKAGETARSPDFDLSEFFCVNVADVTLSNYSISARVIDFK